MALLGSAPGAGLGLSNRRRPAVFDASKTALIPLRPLTLGEILDGAFLIVRRNARMMIGLPLVVAGGTAAYALLSLGLWFLLGNTTVDWAQTAVTVFVVVVGLFLVVQCLVWMTAILSRVSLQTVLGEGFAPSQGATTLRTAWPLFFPIAGLSFLQYIATWVIQSIATTAGYLVTLISLTMSPDISLVVGILSAVLAFALMALGYGYVSLTVPALAVESAKAPAWIGKPARPTGVFSSFARSFSLVGLQNVARVTLIYAGAMALCLALTAIIIFGLTLLIALFAQAVSLDVQRVLTDPWTIGITSGVALVLAMSAIVAFIAAVQTLTYLDLRMRREGLDLALRFDCVPVPQPSAPKYLVRR